MTREVAKELLLNISAYDIDMQRGMAKQEAIDMAIKALEQEPCEDAISRKEAIEWIENIRMLNKYYHPRANEDKTLVSEVIDRLKQIPSITPQPNIARWIPVSEALPPRDEDVLAFHRNESFEYQYISWIDDCTGQWAGFIGNLSDDVLAWMPLPEPYKAERGQDDD